MKVTATPLHPASSATGGLGQHPLLTTPGAGSTGLHWKRKQAWQKKKNDQMLIAAGTSRARRGSIVLHFAVTLILLLHSANYNPDMI